MIVTFLVEDLVSEGMVFFLWWEYWLKKINSLW